MNCIICDNRPYSKDWHNHFHGAERFREHKTMNTPMTKLPDGSGCTAFLSKEETMELPFEDHTHEARKQASGKAF